MNKYIGLGNLTANPEYKINEKGTQICTFRVAINDRQNVLFINVKCFAKLAELCQKYLQKGSKVLVDGRLDMFQNAEKVCYYEIVANDVQFLNKIKELDK